MTRTALNDLQVIPDPQDKKISILPSFKTELRIQITVPGDWLALCTLWSDVFSTDYIGYWARGVKQDGDLGWLVWEFGEDERFDAANLGGEKEDRMYHTEAIQAWKAGKPLPPHYHALNREAAVKAYLKMVSEKSRGGIDWYENGDSTSYDVAIQLALLGEIKYG